MFDIFCLRKISIYFQHLFLESRRCRISLFISFKLWKLSKLALYIQRNSCTPSCPFYSMLTQTYNKSAQNLLAREYHCLIFKTHSRFSLFLSSCYHEASEHLACHIDERTYNVFRQTRLSKTMDMCVYILIPVQLKFGLEVGCLSSTRKPISFLNLLGTKT